MIADTSIRNVYPTNSGAILNSINVLSCATRFARHRFDGDVYTALMESTRGNINPMNKSEVIEPVVSLGGIGLVSSM